MSQNTETLVYVIHTGMSGYLPNSSIVFREYEDAISYMWDEFLNPISDDEIVEAYSDINGDIVEIEYEHEKMLLEETWLSEEEIEALEEGY